MQSQIICIDFSLANIFYQHKTQSCNYSIEIPQKTKIFFLYTNLKIYDIINMNICNV